jgi:hypothetical protein
LIWRGVFHPRFPESLQPKQARVAPAARGSVGARIVAGEGDGVVHAQRQAALDDLTLGKRDQRSVDRHPAPLLDSGPRGQVGHLLKGAHVFRAAVGIPAVIHGVRAHENIGCAKHLGPTQRKRQEDGVASRHVCRGNSLADLFQRSVLRHLQLPSKRGAAEGAKIDVEDNVLSDTQTLGDPARSLQLGRVPLTVPEGKRVHIESLIERDGCRGG